MNSLTIDVRGIPQPKGSAKAFVIKGTNRAIVTNDNPKCRPWANDVRMMAQQKAPKGGPVTGPVFLEMTFYMPMPKSHKAGTVPHTKRPDLDKLVRAVKDALKGVVYLDDSQVYALRANKQYGTVPGVFIQASW